MSDEKKITQLIEKDLESVSGGMISFKPLNQTLKKKGISIKTLEEECELNPAQLNRIKYDHGFAMKMVKKLCEVLNCEPSDIIEIVDDDK